MKKIILFSGLLFLISCSVTKKSFNKNQSRVDSTAKAVSNDVVISKKDSSGSGVIKIKEETKTDGGYSKVTTIKEYLSDEFDFGAVKDSFIAPVISGKKKPVLIRETTITEKGTTQSNTNKTTISKNAAHVNNVDSASHEKVSEVAVKSEIKNLEKVTNKKKFLPGAVLLIIVLSGVLIFYKKFHTWKN